MKPYAFDKNVKNYTGCCPGHDWPRCRRWAGKYGSAASQKADRKSNSISKRIRRRRDKRTLRALE